MQNNSINFCTSFLWWFTEELPKLKWLKKEYVNYNAGLKRWELKADFVRLYPKYLNMPYPQVFEEKPQSFFATGTLILLACKVLVSKYKLGEFVAEVNRRLMLYNADVRLNLRGRFRAVTDESRTYDEAEDYPDKGRLPVNWFFICGLAVILLEIAML